MPDFSDLPAELTPANFDGLVSKHGQHVRWIRRRKCYCVNEHGRVDPRHKACEGRGWLSDLQTEFSVIGEQVKHAGKFIFPKFSPIVKINRIYRTNPYIEYDVSEVGIAPYKCNPKSVRICTGGSGESYHALSASQQLFVDYDYTIATPIIKNDVTYLGNGVLQLDDFTFNSSKGLFDLEVLFVTSITFDGKPKEIIGHSGKYIDIKTDGTESNNKEWLVAITYAQPPILAIQQISAKMRYEDAYVHSDGDAIITVPYNYGIGNGDVFTALVPGSRTSQNLEITAGMDEYALPQFDVSNIVDIEDASGRDYVSGVDFVIKSRNVLKFLEGGNRPDGKAAVMFNYYPSFVALLDRPNLRTPENKKFPKKISLQLWENTNNERKNFSVKYDRNNT